MCVCVSPLKRDYFWSSVYLDQIRNGDSFSIYAPTCTQFYRIMIVGRSCEKNQFLAWKITKDSFFYGSIYDRNLFIVVLKYGRPVVNIWEGLHRKSIKQADFFVLTLFVGCLSMRGPSEHFRWIILWSGMQGQVFWVQKDHIAGFLQICSGMPPGGCQTPCQTAICLKMIF